MAKIMKFHLGNLTRALLYLSVFLIPFYIFRFKILGVPTNVLEISIFAAFILHLIEHALGKKKIELINIDYVIIVFLFFALIAVSVSPDKSVALGIFKGWFLAPALLYFVAKDSFNTKDVYKLSIPLFISLIAVSVWSILQKFGVISTLFYQSGDSNFVQYLSGNVRLFGPFESPNFLAMFLVPVFFLSFSLFDRIKNVVLKIIFVILALAPLYVLYFTKSRGGLLALFLGAVIFAIAYILYRYKVYKSPNLKVIIGFLMSVLVFFTYRTGFDPVRDNTRIEIYKYSWTMIKSYFLSGIGLGDFQNKIDALSAGNAQFRTQVLQYALHPHNLYLAMWLYLGFGGLITFVVMTFQFFVRAFRSLNSKQIIYPIATMTAILAHGLVDTTYFKNDLSAIFFLTLTFAVIISNNPSKVISTHSAQFPKRAGGEKSTT